MGETHIPVALQLYTVRDEAAKDFLGTLARVAAMGYAGVELAGMGGLSARRLREALGNRYIVVPALPEAMRSREASYAAVTGELNAIGAACRERGMALAYHNHAFEFQRFGGRYALEILYDGTDPALVKGEPDVYWMVYAGADPAAWLRNHPGRCPLVHLKDMAPGAERTFAEVGEGTIDFRPIFAAGATAGVEWYIVEQDRCARPALESAALSLRHLKEWGIA